MGTVLLEILSLILLDALFIGVFMLLLWPLCNYRRAAAAVLQRNFVGYFSNPTGYVFLCLFVLLTSFAAFWPHEFFTANLANLDQLNRYLPYIMLVFIPAITMSVWAEERSQGTDELLLTLPANDFDIVMGKYLAAASIFTASLLFSQVSNYAVLAALAQGDVDTGLFFATYFGYWLVGLAMLSVGMVASFLTSNLTVGFILGAVFNAPLAFAANADVIVPSAKLSQAVKFWSLASHFEDLGRGVISMSSFVYFILIVALGLYLSMVFIGSRHWSGGRDGHSMLGHFVVRTIALFAIAVSLVVFFANNFSWARYDATKENIASLSPKTRQIIRDLESEHPIRIVAYISAEVPEIYVQTKYNLVSLLKEFDAMSGGKIAVEMHENLEPFSEQAARAQETYGITPTLVRTRSRGAFKDQEIILGAAFICGLEKVVVPFFDYGVPVEYELVRSIGTVAEGQRKKIGVLRTDAQLYGGFSFAGGMPRQIPKQELVIELEKQYDVEEVDPSNPIDTEKYDVLLAVQPSSLAPEQFTNFVDAVTAGVATAIFEDPLPIFMGNAPGTGEPKQQPGGGMFGGGGGPQPKGDMNQLWRALGINSPGQPGMMGGFNPDIAWQSYNPYPKLQIQGIPDTWVFASNEAEGGEDSIDGDDPITRGLKQVLLPMPGTIEPAADADSDLKFTPLVKTSSFGGTIGYDDVRQNQQTPERMANLQVKNGSKVLAARIRSERAANMDEESDKESDEESDEDTTENRGINVVYVADIDLMINAFLRIRARPDEDEEINWRFENVNFLLNVIDVLSGDDSYVEIRRRKPHHSTLRVVESITREARGAEFDARIKFEQDFDTSIKDTQKKHDEILKEFKDKVDDLKKRQEEGEEISITEFNVAHTQLAIKEQQLQQKLDVEREAAERARDTEIEKKRRDTDLAILKTQNEFKAWAVAIPPILPLIVGVVVFVVRRLREREGVAKSRLR